MLQLWDKLLAMRKRITVAAVVGLASGTFCWFLLKRLHQNAGDFRWAIHLAQRIVARQNPYDTPLEQYPLPAVFFGFPFLRLAPEVAGGLFYGISSALLAFGLTRENYGRLRVFLAYPYWAGVLTAQWPAIIAASAFFPVLLPATMMKPQVGLPGLFDPLLPPRVAGLPFRGRVKLRCPAAMAAVVVSSGPLL